MNTPAPAVRGALRRGSPALSTAPPPVQPIALGRSGERAVIDGAAGAVWVACFPGDVFTHGRLFCDSQPFRG